VAGARVFASRKIGRAWKLISETTTGEDGGFELAVDEGREHGIEAVFTPGADDRRASGCAAVWYVRAGREDLRLDLAPATEEFTGTVSWITGERIPDLPIEVVRDGRPWVRLRARTDAAGEFRVRGVDKTWLYTIAVELPESVRPLMAMGGDHLRGGRRDVKIRIAECGSVSGKILTRSGDPLRRWMFYWVHDDLPLELKAGTGMDGTFSAERLPVGSYHLRVMSQRPSAPGAYDIHLLGPVSTGQENVVLRTPF
jgi:hypothetical protein